jgi:hypothetical protein
MELHTVGINVDTRAQVRLTSTPLLRTDAKKHEIDGSVDPIFWGDVLIDSILLGNFILA